MTMKYSLYTNNNDACQNVTKLYEDGSWDISQNINKLFILSQAFTPKNKEILTQPNIFTPMFFIACFATDQIWKLPKFSATDEWIKKMWLIYSVECNSAIRIRCTLQFAASWMKYEGIMLSEVNQKDKDKHQMASLICRYKG